MIAVELTESILITGLAAPAGWIGEAVKRIVKSRSVNPKPHKEMNAVYLGGRVSVSPQSLLESHNCITITNEHIMQKHFSGETIKFPISTPKNVYTKCSEDTHILQFRITSTQH